MHGGSPVLSEQQKQQLAADFEAMPAQMREQVETQLQLVPEDRRLGVRQGCGCLEGSVVLTVLSLSSSLQLKAHLVNQFRLMQAAAQIMQGPSPAAPAATVPG